MKKNIKIFVLLVLLVFVSACSLRKAKSSQSVSDTKARESENAAKQENDYESAIFDSLKPYWDAQEIAGIKNKILELRAPAEYLDLHFNLVTAFELLEQGRAESDQAKIEAGLEKLNKLPDKYSWIK